VSRAETLAGAVADRELDALLVTDLVNVRYLTGYTGSNGLAIVGRGVRRFLTDFRYAAQVEREVPDEWTRAMVLQELLAAVPEHLPEHTARLGFDDAHLSVRAHAKLSEALAGRAELVPAGGMVEALRAVKDDLEIARIRAAAQLADEALDEVLEHGLAGRTERDVAFALEMAMRRRGAEAISFDPIVASAERGALPHAVPRDVQIPRDVLVTIDWGARHEGYCSDCTRTFATGDAIDDEAREVYELVLRAQEAALAAVRPGPTGRQVDAVARDIIDAAGHGEHFGHGLGHGVGLAVHEGPRLSRLAPDVALETGNVVTVEPGVYLPGNMGVRIEDLVVVSRDGHDVLSSLPKALQVVG
jgi:Xaa-Pro aminopeptidase